MTQASARQAARRLYKRVCFSEGALGSYQLSSLMSQTYDFLKIPFKASQNDIKLYEQVLDADRDGKVTLKDLEARAIEYLCKNTIVSTISSTGKSQATFKSSDTQANYKSFGTKDNSAYSDANLYSQTAATQPKSNLYSQNDYGASYKFQSNSAVESSFKYNDLSKPTDFTSSAKAAQPAQYSYNFKPSFQNKTETKTEQNQAISGLSSSNFGGDTIYSYDKNQSSSRSFAQPIGQPQYSYKDHGYSSGNDYGSTNYVNQSVKAEDQYKYESSQPQESHEEVYESNDQYQERQYSEIVRQYLQVVSQVFMRYADQTNYTVTEDDVAELLRDTYAVLGREGYNPSPEDVKTWMKLCDVNQDGKVEYQDYEYFVVKSLERSGLDLYD